MKVTIICRNCKTVHTYGDLDSPVEVAAHVIMCSNCASGHMMLSAPAATRVDTEIATLRKKLADAAVPPPPAVPPKDTLVLVRYTADTDWSPRYSTGELDDIGHLMCYRDGTTSKTARDTTPTAWTLWKILEGPAQ